MTYYVFQYSLHVETSDGNLTHYNFFESKDCRRHFIEQLIKDLPKTGTILVYNMEGAEKLRLKQLASQFEEYREELESICLRMVDLSKPFEAGLYYNSKNAWSLFFEEYIACILKKMFLIMIWISKMV